MRNKLFIFLLVAMFGIVGCSREEESATVPEQQVGTTAPISSNETAANIQTAQPVQPAIQPATVQPTVQPVPAQQVTQIAPAQPAVQTVAEPQQPVQAQAMQATPVQGAQDSLPNIQVTPSQTMPAAGNQPSQVQVTPITTTDVTPQIVESVPKEFTNGTSSDIPADVIDGSGQSSIN